MTLLPPIKRVTLNLVSLHKLLAFLIDLLVTLLALFILLHNVLMQDLGLGWLVLLKVGSSDIIAKSVDCFINVV